MEVSISMVYAINPNMHSKATIPNLEQELKERKDKLLLPAAQQASLLIANITNVNSSKDLLSITPPFFKKEKQG